MSVLSRIYRCVNLYVPVIAVIHVREGPKFRSSEEKLYKCVQFKGLFTQKWHDVLTQNVLILLTFMLFQVHMAFFFPLLEHKMRNLNDVLVAFFHAIIMNDDKIFHASKRMQNYHKSIVIVQNHKIVRHTPKSGAK